MRAIFALPLVLAGGVAGAALAQSAPQPADARVQTISTAAAPAEPARVPVAVTAHDKSEEDAAAAALAMSIRHRQAEEARIARYACAAGDASKCEAANAQASAGSPSS